MKRNQESRLINFRKNKKRIYIPCVVRLVRLSDEEFLDLMNHLINELSIWFWNNTNFGVQ